MYKICINKPLFYRELLILQIPDNRRIMKIHIPSSAFLANINAFIKRFDFADSEVLHILGLT